MLLIITPYLSVIAIDSGVKSCSNINNASTLSVTCFTTSTLNPSEFHLILLINNKLISHHV